MSHFIHTRLTTLCFLLVPTVSACTLTDIAGNVDAGSVGGQPGTGGAQGYDSLTGGQLSTGGAAAETGGAAADVGGAPGGTGGASAGTGGASSTGGSTVRFDILAGVDCSSTAPTALPTWAAADGCVIGNESTEVVGTWEGYIQGTAIGDEASTIRLKILGANANGLCGTVTFGIHTAPVTLPPVTDSFAVYPPESIAPWTYHGTEATDNALLGVAYTMQDGRVLAQRATFKVGYKEVFKDWCSLQTSYPIFANCSSFACSPGDCGSGAPDPSSYYCSNPSQVFHETLFHYSGCRVSHACECNVEQCVASRRSPDLFDLTFSNDQALGTLNAQKVVVFNRVTCAASGESCQTNDECCSQSCSATTDGGYACE